MQDTLKVRIHQIFHSIDGEYNGFRGIGQPTTFIRFFGCSLGCCYCDTPQRPEQCKIYEMTSFKDMYYKKIRLHSWDKFTITGGEPFEQEAALIEIVRLLLNTGKYMSIETNGTHTLARFKQLFPYFTYQDRIRIIADYKLEGAKVRRKFHPDNFGLLGREDVIKFVISKEGEWEQFLTLLPELPDVTIALSPALSDNHERNIHIAQHFVKSITSLPSYFYDRRVVISIQNHKIIGVK